MYSRGVMWNKAKHSLAHNATSRPDTSEQLAHCVSWLVDLRQTMHCSSTFESTGAVSTIGMWKSEICVFDWN
jgi:hypothetical protein